MRRALAVAPAALAGVVALLAPQLALARGADGHGPGAAQRAAAQEDCAALERAYAQAMDAWRTRQRQERDPERRRALRQAPPGAEFLPRFEALADAGEGRALLWIAVHAAELGLGQADERARLADALGRLVDEHAGAAWFGETLTQLARAERLLEQGRTAALYAVAVQRAEGLRRADALLAQARFLRDARLEGARGAALAALRRILAEHPASSQSRAATEELYVLEHLSVGALAPDFEATDASGQPLRLSGLRGQVVVLHFWGFW